MTSKTVGSEWVREYYCNLCGDFLGTNVRASEHADLRDCIAYQGELIERITRGVGAVTQSVAAAAERSMSAGA